MILGLHCRNNSSPKFRKLWSNHDDQNNKNKDDRPDKEIAVIIPLQTLENSWKVEYCIVRIMMIKAIKMRRRKKRK